MSKTLTVTNSPNDQSQSPAAGTAASLQQTDDSATLGLHIEKKADAAIDDPNMIDLLKTEAAGSVQDSSPANANGHYFAWRIGTGLTLMAAGVLLFVAYKRLATRSAAR